MIGYWPFVHVLGIFCVGWVIGFQMLSVRRVVDSV